MAMDTFESTEEMGVIIEMDGHTNTSSQFSCLKYLCFIFGIVGLIVSFFLGRWTVKPEVDIPHKGQTSAQTLLQQIDTRKLRIEPDVNECEEPLCVKCKAQILRSQNTVADAFKCKSEPQAVCFKCNGTCQPLDVLRRKVHVNQGWIECEEPKQITCCILSQMGNAGQICGPGGSYNCYGDPVPICKCPHGRDGDRCQNDAKTTLNCTCFVYPFCGQEEMVDCEKGKGSPCHMAVERDGQSYNCICDIPSGDSDPDVDTCSVPYKKPLTDGSEQLSYSLTLLTIPVVYILTTVDKT